MMQTGSRLNAFLFAAELLLLGYYLHVYIYTYKYTHVVTRWTIVRY